ncbi:MAG: hypothetical protein HYZ39_17650 [Mycolicibacterium cosmeticum]|nr:hypothetical protein [Mycolicibacterium cosmeticum]
MTFLGMAAALAAASLLGFVVGRRSVSKAPSWNHRTSRSALAKQALSLVTLLAAGELQRAVGRGVAATPRRVRTRR